MDTMVFTGLAVGLAFGFALQRGRFCMNSAFRDILVFKDNTLLKAVSAAILVSMAGFTVMAMTDVITLNPKPLIWGANILGGLLFGVGMVLAGGCASGISYRVGEGMVGAMSAVAGLSFAALVTAAGVFHPFVSSLQENTKITADNGENLTLANLFGVPYYALAFGIVIVSVVIWVIVARRHKEEEDDFEYDEGSPSWSERIFKRGWGWLATGIVIGVISIIAFPLSAEAGRNYPLGITGGYVTLMKTLTTDVNALAWDSFLIIGLIIGAAVAALIAGEFGLRAPAPKVILQTFAGGFLMGFGAVCSAGCNIGHILSGVPQLSLGSILGGVSIVLGAWFAAYLIFVRPMHASSEETEQ
jgi:uncharacterized membrane protein YedE/YeeE